MTTLTIPQAAVRLGCSTAPLRKAIDAGDLPITTTNPLRVRPVDVDALAQRLMAEHGPECRRSVEPFPTGGSGSDCGCVACHCGPRFQPGGFMGSCARCLRPRVINGKVAR